MIGVQNALTQPHAIMDEPTSHFRNLRCSIDSALGQCRPCDGGQLVGQCKAAT
jgi:hypothetical protein